MYLGSLYLIVRDFNKSIEFYEKLLKMPVSSQNMERFAQFEFDVNNVSPYYYFQLADPDGNIIEITG